MPQELRTLTFIGSISFNGGDLLPRRLDVSFTDETVTIVSSTRHAEVQTTAIHFDVNESAVIAAFAAALQRQEQDVPRILALAAEELPVTPPSDASQATA